jgi:hypothetical protein
MELMSEVELREERLTELRMEAEHARRRLDLYRARPDSERPRREPARAAEAADSRLRHARQSGSSA